MNDVDISPNPKELLFDKHVDYIAHHGKDKNDFVRDATLRVPYSPTSMIHSRISSRTLRNTA